jgi:hypothetical protein
MRRWNRLLDKPNTDDHGLEEANVKPLKPIEIVIALALFILIAVAASYWFFLLAR